MSTFEGQKENKVEWQLTKNDIFEQKKEFKETLISKYIIISY